MSKGPDERELTAGGADAAARIEDAASLWLARRERGFTPEERTAFEAWVQADPRHLEAVAWLESAWHSLDRLRAMAPASRADPDPDLLRPRHRPVLRYVPWYAAAAAAVAIAAGTAFWTMRSPTEAGTPPLLAAETVRNEQVTLPDGSAVELNRGSEIAVHYSETERRIVLVRGEANFTVAKNPARPFVVEAGRVVVRAVGTVFNVRLEPDAVEVLVTEGGVRVGDSRVVQPAEPTAFPVVQAGQRARVVHGPAVVPRLDDVPAAEIERLLAWREWRLVFDGRPLSEVVEEFNRYNSRPLVLGDDGLGDLRIGGNFRADNVDAFVRLLESSFSVRAEQGAAGEIVLRRK